WFAPRCGLGLNALLGLNAALPWKCRQCVKRLDIPAKVKIMTRLHDLEQLISDDAGNEPTSLLLRVAVRHQASKRLASCRRITHRELIIQDLKDRFSGNVRIARHEA